MEVKLDPKIIDAISRHELRKDWRAIAKRLEAAEGAWVLVGVVQRSDRGVADETRERLRAVGCRAQVVGLFGLDGAISSEGLYAGPSNPRPWRGFAVFARIPHSVIAPSGKVY